MIESDLSEIKFNFEILKGYGAIPHKMPSDEKKEEIALQNKEHP
jgi:hypothetical protein